MPAQLLDGKILAEKIKGQIKQEVEQLKVKYGRPPSLAAVQVGKNEASAVYIKSQMANAQRLGIEYKLHELDGTLTQKGVLDYIEGLNNDKNITGIILQMPLPQGIDSKAAQGIISLKKDVEAIRPENLGRLIFGKPKIGPCTAMAAMELINSTGIDLYGKEAVVVGHSEIVGKPVASMLLEKFCTITICHIATGQRGVLADHVRRAEILVVAVGKAGLVKGEWIKEGAVVVDVGINRSGDKIVGDVEFEEAAKRAAYITPVPGGVGPLTVTMLMRNTVEAFKMQV